jgi:peptidoglycan/LPS O-acetylase OafA/YrhL
VPTAPSVVFRLVSSGWGRQLTQVGDGERATVGDAAADVRGLAALDAIRALAAIGVVLAHVAAVLVLRGMSLRWAAIGDAGVLVFFVLSGYLIAASVLRPARFAVRGYMIRRALRILPLYYASMLVALLLIDPTPLLSGPGRADVAAHVVLLHGLSRGMRYSIAGIWWTLTVEWLFYLFMAIVAVAFRRSPQGWLIASGMILLGVVWRLVVFETSTSTADSAYLVQQLPGAADLFGIGMLTALAARTGAMPRLWRDATLRSALLVLSAGLVAGTMYVYYDRKPGYWEDGAMVVLWPLVLALGVAGMLVCLTRATSIVHAATRWTGLAYLGVISFGIYLFHPFVIEAFDRAWFADGRTVSALPFILAALAATVLVSTMFHYVLERPAMRWGRRLAGVSPRSRSRAARSAPGLAGGRDGALVGDAGTVTTRDAEETTRGVPSRSDDHALGAARSP